MDILEQIRANYGSFSRPRQRISDFILNYPEQCCFLSLRSFAQQVGTTEVTVLNFCRGLGLGSYMDLKKALQDYLIVRVNAGDRLKLAVAGSGSAQDLYQRVCRAEREALQSTLDGNSVELLLAFTQALRRARRIFIAAHDFSRFPADTWSTGCSHWSWTAASWICRPGRICSGGSPPSRPRMGC